MSKKRSTYSLVLLRSVSLIALTLGSPVYANPEGGVVSAGTATITESGSKMDIHQHSDKAVIDWRGFDIGVGEHTQFHQPSSNATALNRVNSSDPSHIAGRLSANGNVILINPNGVFFDRGARVDVNGLIATTADIDNHDFMAGKMDFDKPGNPDAAIVNAGTITAKEAGLVGLVAPRVENHGVINARLGKVHLASGDTMGIDLHGDGLFHIEVSDEVTSQLVANTGSVTAEGGSIALTAATGKNIVDSLIRVEGELNAPSVKQQGGTIIITGQDADVQVDGYIRASGEEKAGEILIGGDVMGSGTLPWAKSTTISDKATITANSTQGDGGKIVVWAGDSTEVAGRFEAKGATSGRGGFIETSGKQTLTVDRDVHVDTGGGTWLLDPTDITVTSAPGANNIAPGTITTALGSNDVVIHTGEDTVGGDAGDITIEEDITYTSSRDLTFLAHRHIRANANVQNGGDGDVNLVAGWNQDAGFGATAAGLSDPASVNITTITSSAANYGLNNGSGHGSVFVNNASGTQGVAIGSRDGATTVAGYDVQLNGGNSNDEYAHVGFLPDSAIIGDSASGVIDIDAKNNLLLYSTNRSYTHIGHGGNLLGMPHDFGTLSGSILLNAENINMDGGSGFRGYAKIGHGGRRVRDTSFGGSIVVNARGSTSIRSGNRVGTNASWTQIGHGGFQSSGIANGNIRVTSGNLSLIAAANGTHAYSVIGHGSASQSTDMVITGHVVTTVDNELSLVKSLDSSSPAKIGHSINASGTISNANVRISAGALDFDAADTGTFNINNADFVDNMEANLAGGDVTIASTNANMTLVNGFDWSTASNHTLSFLGRRNVTFSNDITQTGASSVLNTASGWDGTSGLNNDGTITWSNVLTPNPNAVRRTFNSGEVTTNEANIRAGKALASAGSPFAITADTLNLDAGTEIFATIDATNVDIGNNSTGVTLTGLVDGGADQDAADKITGGPGNDPAYTFQGFTIRLAAPTHPSGGGGGGTPASPVVPVTPVAPEPVTPPVNEAVPTPEPKPSPSTPVVVTSQPVISKAIVPPTVEIVSQVGSYSSSEGGAPDVVITEQTPAQGKASKLTKRVIVLGNDPSAMPSSGEVMITPEAAAEFGVTDDDL